MKVFARVTSAVIVMIVLTLAFPASALAAGGTLNFIKSTPEEGNARVPVENVGVKVFFDGNVTSDDVWENNAACFTFADSKGNIVPSTAYRSQKEGEEGYILVLAQPLTAEGEPNGQLEQDSDYNLTISADLLSVDGAGLGEDMTINFRTMDVAANSRLSVILMVVMMVAVIALMFVTNWRKMKAEAEAAALMKANPYKIAKDRKITVDEAKELIEKAKEKNKKQLEKVGGEAPKPEEKKSAVPRIESKKKQVVTHKVKGPKPASEGGSTYKTGRKAEKARQAKVEEAKKKAKAAAGGQARSGGSKKGSKGKSKKK